MAIDKNVRVNLILEDLLSSGAKKVSDLMKGDFKKSFKDAGAQMIIFNQAAELGKKVLAAFDKTIGKTIKAASVQEAAVNRLNSSLFQMGDFTEENSKSLQHFASELQAVTRIGDEVTLGQLALAQSMGANVEQSKALVAAAADMSAALGISFESAVRNLSKTLGGVPGRLAELIPEVKN
ncbi:MAG: hypothetical protein K0U41_01005, partial [Gammaproteobacteria bacterium]|nr:hypothetical protein [Gammaproteobacteria bacterium]